MRDPEKLKEYKRRHYLKYRERYLEKSVNQQRRNKERWTAIKDNLSCVECGENRNPCLAFHHRNPAEKDYNISTLVKRCSYGRLLEEMEKCDVLCHNCHAIKHWELQNKSPCSSAEQEHDATNVS